MLYGGNLVINSKQTQNSNKAFKPAAYPPPWSTTKTPSLSMVFTTAVICLKKSTHIFIVFTFHDFMLAEVIIKLTSLHLSKKSHQEYSSK